MKGISDGKTFTRTEYSAVSNWLQDWRSMQMLCFLFPFLLCKLEKNYPLFLLSYLLPNSLSFFLSLSLFIPITPFQPNILCIKYLWILSLNYLPNDWVKESSFLYIMIEWNNPVSNDWVKEYSFLMIAWLILA